MNVPKELMERLFLAVGGRGSVGTGGGSSDNELTNWDGSKKRNGWGYRAFVISDNSKIELNNTLDYMDLGIYFYRSSPYS